MNNKINNFASPTIKISNVPEIAFFKNLQIDNGGNSPKSKNQFSYDIQKTKFNIGGSIKKKISLKTLKDDDAKSENQNIVASNNSLNFLKDRFMPVSPDIITRKNHTEKINFSKDKESLSKSQFLEEKTQNKKQ